MIGEKDMARKKSEFLAALGIAFEIFKAIADAVISRGGNDDDLRRIVSEKGLAGKIAEVVMAGRAAVGSFMTLGNRTYEYFSYLRDGETTIGGQTMADRAAKMNGNLGQEDCEFVLAHQAEIPAALCGKAVFVFPGWRLPGGSSRVACVRWGDDCWVLDWDWLGFDWYGSGRLLRRK